MTSLTSRSRSPDPPARCSCTAPTSSTAARKSAGAGAARFVLLADYEVWGARWTGKAAWPNQALGAAWVEMMERATPAERCLFGFPAPGDPYWNVQTVTDVGSRYPQMDMAPYVT